MNVTRIGRVRRACNSALVLALLAVSGLAGKKEEEASTMATNHPASAAGSRIEAATLAGGCFWCTEAIFKRQAGVVKIRPGYTGGTKANPTYKDVCTGKTGHAEAIEITFDPAIVTYAALLDLFWRAHDPTTLNRQGGDVGTQYRSAIFFHGEKQRLAAEASKKALEESKQYKEPIVTVIEKAGTFYPAEEYHHDYFARNPDVPYCRMVIAPKVKKLEAGH